MTIKNQWEERRGQLLSEDHIRAGERASGEFLDAERPATHEAAGRLILAFVERHSRPILATAGLLGGAVLTTLSVHAITHRDTGR